MKRTVKAMIFAAGLGTRLYPLTADKPKALVTLDGKTLLQNAIETVCRAGIDEIVVNTHHFSEQIKIFLSHHSFDANIQISDESTQLLDTAGGLKLAEPLLSHATDILLYNVDIVSSIDLIQLIQQHINSQALATLAVRNRTSSRHFIFDQDTMQLCGWENSATSEKKLVRNPRQEIALAFSGIHVVNNEIFNYIPANKKLSVTPLYLDLAPEHRIFGHIHHDETWIDVGKYDETKFLNLQ